MKATLETIFKKNQIKATHTIHASIFFFSGNHASFVFNSNFTPANKKKKK